MTIADAEAVALECPAVRRAAPAVVRRLAVRWDDTNTNTSVVGTTPEAFGIREFPIASGRRFDAEENRGRRRVAVLGPTTVANLFDDVDPIGLQIRIGRVPFEVIGVTRPKGVDINGVDQDDLVLVPLEAAMRRLLNVTHLDAIYAQAEEADLLDRAEGEIRALLRDRHRLGDRPDDFTIQNQATLLEAERETAQSMTLLIGSVAGISLLVGGIGILAVMLISVRERTHEIGLRRALGATRADIRVQFLLESGLIAGAGGLVGVLAGVAAVVAVARLGYWTAVISWPAALGGCAFSIAVGLIFGIYPAMRAAALEPIEALRGE